jgi:hypothetical protein
VSDLSYPAELKIRFIVELAPTLLFDLVTPETWEVLVATRTVFCALFADSIPSQNDIYTRIRDYLVLLDSRQIPLKYSEEMLSYFSMQVSDWGSPRRLALWSSESQNRQLAGVHLDFDTAGQMWAEQVQFLFFLSLFDFLYCCSRSSIAARRFCDIGTTLTKRTWVSQLCCLKVRR